MKELIAKHQQDILGTLSGFDRVRFRGTFRVLAVVKLLLSWLAQRMQKSVEAVARGRGQH